MVKLGEINPVVWDKVIEEMETKLEDIEFSGDDIVIDWKINADAARLEREVFEKYGHFKDIILHPKFQATKQWLEENTSFDLILDDGNHVMPWTTIIIILFMLNKRVSSSVLVLIGAFLFNINPLYVIITSILYHWYFSSGYKPKQYKKSRQNKISLNLCKPIDINTIINDKNVINDNKYDHILIGNNISTLYCAALLSRVGHRCLVLQPNDTAKPYVSHSNILFIQFLEHL